MIVLPVTVLLAGIFCWFYLILARRLQWLDQPNERSSHRRPTPHGGGVPLLIAFAVGIGLAGLGEGVYLVLIVLALLLMLVGVLDDIFGLSVRLRMSLYALSCFGLVSALFPGGSMLWLIIATVGSLWFLNLYNFMDGIDGIAALQCIQACFCVALLTWLGGGANTSAYVLFCLLLAAAHLGFLLWNWPPARLFMGDAGSVPTGFLLAGLILVGWIQGLVNPGVWLILLAVFIGDATGTLLWRLVTGQQVTQAHRLHAYQRLSRHWDSHLAVDLLLLAINAIWLFPLAWLAQTAPQYTLFLVILAYVPIVLGMVRTAKLA